MKGKLMNLALELTHVFDVPLDNDDKDYIRLKHIQIEGITIVVDDGYEMTFTLPFTHHISYQEQTGNPQRIKVELSGYNPINEYDYPFDWYYADKVKEVYFENIGYYGEHGNKKNIEYKIFKYLRDKYGPNGYNVHLEDIILINEDTGEEEELPDAQYS